VSATRHTPIERADVEYIVTRLRQRDRDEIFALRWDDDEAKLVSEVMLWAGAMTWVWRWDGVPVSLQGTWAVRPGVWSCWAFGTDEWPHVVLAMTKHSRRFIIPALLRARFHRAEALALATHRDSRRWIEALGAREEGVRRGIGRHGEDFISYVWTPDDVIRLDRAKQYPGTEQRMLALAGRCKAG
jgi:hypothetical protein